MPSALLCYLHFICKRLCCTETHSYWAVSGVCVFILILHVWPSQVLVIDKLCTFISLIFNFYCVLHLKSLSTFTRHFNHCVFVHPSEWLLSALGLFPPVWPTLPSNLRQVFLKWKKVSVVYLWFYTWSTQKQTHFFYVVLGKVWKLPDINEMHLRRQVTFLHLSSP